MAPSRSVQERLLKAIDDLNTVIIDEKNIKELFSGNYSEEGIHFGIFSFLLDFDILNELPTVNEETLNEVVNALSEWRRCTDRRSQRGIEESDEETEDQQGVTSLAWAFIQTSGRGLF